MKILFVTGHSHLPQLYGGLQISNHQLCQGLQERGHKVALLAGLLPKGLFGWKARLQMQINKKLFGCKISRDTAPGYTVWRTWFPWEVVEYVIQKEKPDLIIVTTGKIVPIVQKARPTGIPILVQLHDVQFQLHGGDFAQLGDIPCIANSRFTASKYHSAYGINPTVIYPFISTSEYQTETTRENVTFINPHVEKGLDIALEIARLCPDIPFSFVESWPLTIKQRRELAGKLSTLPNVTLHSPQKDMRAVYGKCKILLTPSIVEEAYGRVVTEAQISGIPVIASARGGLPEAVGRGGLLIDPEATIEPWVKAVRKLWQNDTAYAELSAEALDHAHRSEMSFSYQVDAYEKLFLIESAKSYQAA